MFFFVSGILDAGLFDKALVSWTELNVKHPAAPCCELVRSKCLQLYLELVLYRFSAVTDLWQELCKGANPVQKFAGWSGPRGFWVPPELRLCGLSAVAVEDPGFAKHMPLG